MESHGITMEIAWRCEACGIGSDVHAPRCPGCGARGGLQRESLRKLSTRRKNDDVFGKVEDADPLDVPRATTGIASLDKLFGKNETGEYAGQTGLALQGVTLLAGPKGLGKTVLVFEMLARFIQDGVRCAFLAAEQSVDQIRGAIVRVGLDPILRHMSIERTQNFNVMMTKLAASRVQLVVLDSLNTTVDPTDNTREETLAQVHIAEKIYADAWRPNAPPRAWIVISQMTSDQKIAGREKLLHLVDTLPVLERSTHGDLIELCCKDKTRFARSGIVAKFRMDDQGKMHEYLPPSATSLDVTYDTKVDDPILYVKRRDAVIVRSINDAENDKNLIMNYDRSSAVVGVQHLAPRNMDPELWTATDRTIIPADIMKALDAWVVEHRPATKAADPEERAVFLRNNDRAFEGLLARSKRR